MKKTYLPFAFTLITAMSLAACSPSASARMAESNKSRETNPPVLDENVKTLVDGNNAFAFDIYQSLHSQNGNLILSPYSISLALAMTYAGARGGTEAQMANVLHFNQSQGQLHPAFNALDLALEKAPENLNQDQQALKLNIANVAWAEQTYPFQQDFLDVIALNYGAGVHLADFIHQFEPARKEINNWVSDQTQNKINDLLPENSLDSYTRMVLVNAVYFKADWLSSFDPNSTGDAPFYLLDGSQVAVKMMRDHNYIPYIKGDGYQAIELPYAGETAAMDIIIPDDGLFDKVESALDSGTFATITGNMQQASVALDMPKFKFDSDFNLSETLKSMGMPDAFDSNSADFSGMTGAKDLFIGNVIHKAIVAVDEKGTEAAAATAVIMETTSAPMFDVNLTIDHPFIFIIRDKVSGQILFIGHVMNPAQ